MFVRQGGLKGTLSYYFSFGRYVSNSASQLNTSINSYRKRQVDNNVAAAELALREKNERENAKLKANIQGNETKSVSNSTGRFKNKTLKEQLQKTYQMQVDITDAEIQGVKRSPTSSS